MRILLVNDDGIRAEGLKVLAKTLSFVADVCVSAPDRPRSAVSHGITLHKPLHVDLFPLGDSIRAYAVSGTPVDCVKIGISTLFQQKPDLVVSGINAGPNLGSEILYSGTVSAAAEAMINGIPSIAVSQCGTEPFHYEKAAEFIAQFAFDVEKNGLPTGNVLNINVPTGVPKGVQLTHIGQKQYENCYVKRKDPRGKPYYWIAGKLLPLANKEGSDVFAIESGYISVTPIRFQLDDNETYDIMSGWDLFK